MADFSFHSNTDESAVEQILAEAMDHCILDQITAINCSSFSHSVLPSHLESRFQRLKTFPSSSSIPKPQPQLPPHSANELKKNPISTDSSKPQERERETERHSQKKPSSGYVSSPSDSSNSSSGLTNSPKVRAKSVEGKGTEGKLPSGSLSFRSDSSVSPPKTKKSGCFWCSPKRVLRKKSGNGNRNRNGVVELGLDWGEHDEILTDLKSFSSKEQKKRMKKAMKEEEKLNKEAEKIVKWAKQASARLDFSIDDYDDDDDDDDSRHDFGLH